jgi:cytochrome c peroxidase
MITRRFLIPAVAITLFVQACVPEEDTSVVTQVLDLPQSPYHYFDNGFNNQIPTLGRVLFYDAQLSVNNSVSCGSCHKQTLAFSDNARFSRGFDNRVTSRNSMSIQQASAVRVWI